MTSETNTRTDLLGANGWAAATENNDANNFTSQWFDLMRRHPALSYRMTIK